MSDANREAIAFGEALATPMRLMFETVPKSKLPGSHIYENQAKLAAGGAATPLETVINRMRLTKEQDKDEETGFAAPAPEPEQAPASRFSQASQLAGNPHAQQGSAPAAPARPLNPLAAGLANVAREAGYETPETLRRTSDATANPDLRLGRRETDPYIRPPSTTFGSR